MTKTVKLLNPKGKTFKINIIITGYQMTIYISCWPTNTIIFLGRLCFLMLAFYRSASVVSTALNILCQPVVSIPT